MNELSSQAETERNDPIPVAALDAQLTELIEFVWACEAAARTETRIDAVIRYGKNRGSK
ncbi:MAG TPA: hypothetical protein VLS53_04385 [Candidatus Dormibacteraeota bacterium]|nr:hypothetical protein [Candidatus Dormibacteraeota bacterium]